MRASVASLSKKFISTFFAATLALGLVPAAAFAVDDDGADAPNSAESANADSLNTEDLDQPVISSEVEKSAPIEQNEGETLTSSWEDDQVTVIPAASERINQDMTLQTRTVAQAESTRSYFLAQTLESTRTVPIVSANLPLDTSDNDNNDASQEEEGDGSEDDPDADDPVDASFTLASSENDSAVSAESTVIGSFTYRGITYAVEPGGESVAVAAADYMKLPEDFIEAQVIVLPSMVTADSLNYYSVTRIADNAFSTVKFQESEEGITAITIPASITEIGDDAFLGFGTLQYVIVSEDNPNYSMYDGCLYDADQTRLLLIPEGRLGAVRIAPSVTEIDPEVFSHCPSVDTLVADADSAAYQLLMENDLRSHLLVPGGYDSRDKDSNNDALQKALKPSMEVEPLLEASEYHINEHIAAFAGTSYGSTNIIVYSNNRVYWNFNTTFSDLNPSGVTVKTDHDKSFTNQSYFFLAKYGTEDEGYCVHTNPAKNQAYPNIFIGNTGIYSAEWGQKQCCGGLELNRVVHMSTTFSKPTAIGDDYLEQVNSVGTLKFWFDDCTNGNTGTAISEFYRPGDGGWKYRSDGKTISTQAKTVNHAVNVGSGGSVSFAVEGAPTIAPAANKRFGGWRCSNGNVYQPGDIIENSTNWLFFDAIWIDVFDVEWNTAIFGGNTTLVNRDKSYVNTYGDSILANDAPAEIVVEQVKITDISDQSNIKGYTAMPSVTGPTDAVFLGWTSNADGTPLEGGYKQPGDELAMGEDTAKVWYAVWAHDVTFDPHMDGNATVRLSDQGNLEDYIAYQQPFQRSLPEGILHTNVDGYCFEGYWDDEGTQWFDKNGDPVPGTKWVYAEPVTLTARWTYDVYFDTNTNDPASVAFGSAASRINEVMPLSAGRDIEYTLLKQDEFGNSYYTGTENGRDRVKVVAWKGAKVALPIAQLRSGYDATQDWGTGSTSVYADRIPYDAASGVTETALSEQLAPAGNDLSRTLYAIWDVDPTSASGHARTFFAKLDDTTSYEQNGETMEVDASKVTPAAPSVLRAKYDTTFISAVNGSYGTVKAPVYAENALVFDGYYAKVGNAEVMLTGGADENGYVTALPGAIWRIAPKNADGSWIDETSGLSLEVVSATYDGKTVDAVVLHAKWSLPIRNISFDANLIAASDLTGSETVPAVPSAIEDVQVNVTPLPESEGALPDLAKYSFDGWWDDPVHGTQYYDRNGDLVSEDGAPVTWPSHNKTKLYAHWTYELLIDGNLQGKPDDTVQLASSEVASIASDGSPVAKRTLASADGGRTFTTTVTKGETIALYDASTNVAELASRLRAGERTGYTFVGYTDACDWATTPTRYGAFDFSKLNVSGIARIYMGWNPNATKLSFVDVLDHEGETLDPAKVAGGRAGAPGNEEVLYDDILKNVDADKLPYIPGWDFTGYYLEGVDEPYIGADGVHGDAWDVVAEEATLYARYAHRELSVAYDLHGGRDGKPTVTKVFYPQTMPDGPFKPTRKGYDFAGWFACEHAAEADHEFGCDDCTMFYDADGARAQETWPIDGGATLHAAWTAATYAIEWVYNYPGASPSLFDRTSQLYNERIALPERGEPKRPGHGFVGWYTAATGGAAVTGTESCVLGQGALVPAGEERTLTYYARWDSGQPFRIVLDAGIGGVFAGGATTYVWSGQGATPADRNIDLNTNVAAIDREDWNVGCRLPGAYEFIGWEEEGEGSKIALKDGVVIPANTDGVHTLVAQWEVKLFDIDFYAYDADIAAGSDAANDDYRTATIEGGGLEPATGQVRWTYAASPAESTNVSCTVPTPFPVASVPGYEFLGWREKGGSAAPSRDLVANPGAPKSGTYIAEFAPIEYIFHFFVSETEQEDAVETGAYGEKITLPGIASRTSTSSDDGFVYNGKWALTAHSSDYPSPSTWVPAAQVAVRDILAMPGLTVRTPDGSQSDDPLALTHVYLYARHVHGYSFTVPLRAAIMVAVDDPAAPIKVDSGAIEANTAMGGAYRVISIVSDPVEGEGHAQNNNPGTASTFTDNSGKKRASEVFLTVRNASAASDAIQIPLHETTVIDDARQLSGFTFAYGAGNELALEYGLAFGSGLGPVDFSNNLPVAEGPHYPIARLYYTIGFAS